MILPWRNVSLDGGPQILSSVTDAEIAKLQELADAAEVLEVGSAYGYSTVALALAGAHVTAVDPHAGENPGSLAVLRANLDAYNVADRVTVITEPSQTALPKLEAGTFDLVFIDGDHTEATVTHDVTWALKLLRPGGVLACHDLDEGSCPGVRAALDKLFDHPTPTVDTLFIHRT
jgi:predicted O-methyltransferase YrrM